MAQTFYVEPGPNEIIVAGSFLMTPDSENGSSDVYVSILSDRKNTS